MEYLFSYGTLQMPAVQRDTFGEEVDGEPDALVGYVKEMIEITDPDVLALSGERYHPILRETGNSDDTITGTVFCVTRSQLAQADAYEVEDYGRVSVKLKSGKTAWLYTAKR